MIWLKKGFVKQKIILFAKTTNIYIFTVSRQQVTKLQGSRETTLRFSFSCQKSVCIVHAEQVQMWKPQYWHEITNLGSTKVNDIQNTLKNANVALMAEWSYNALQKL